MMRAASRMDGIQRTLIRQIFDAAPPDAINLGLGQPDLPTPEVIAAAGVAAIHDGRTGYTPTAGNPELRQAIAERYPALASGPQSVVVTIGSQEAMFACCLTLVDPGDEILYPDPGYPAYPVVARLVGARPVPYPLSAERSFRLDPAAIEELLSERTRLVIVSEPSNPTGAISSRADLKLLARLLGSRGIPWVSDEIYSGFTYEGPFVSLGQLDGGDGLVVSGLSKDLSMTGWRIGWVVGPPQIVACITAAHQYLVTCASSVSQAAALAAFGDAGRDAQSRYLEIFRNRREQMADELSKIPAARFRRPDGAFYFFVDLSHYGASLPLSRRILERRNVVAIPGIAFGDRGEGFLRLSFAASEEQIRTGVRRIAEELALIEAGE